MSFTWLQGTAAGDIIHKADIDEIHTNIDSIKDNLANITHDAGVLSVHRGTYLLNNYTNHNTDVDFNHYEEHDVTEYTVKYTGDNAGANSGYNGADYTANNVHDYSGRLSSINLSKYDTKVKDEPCPVYYGTNLNPNYPTPCTNDTVRPPNPCLSDNFADDFYYNSGALGSNNLSICVGH